MRKDVKTGMFIGVVLVISATLIFSMLPGASLKSRAIKHAEKSKQTTAPLPAIDPEPQEDKQITTSPSKEPAPEKPKPQQQTTTPVAPVEQIRYHIVVDGETLSSIAERYYGSSKKFTIIYNANKDTYPRLPHLRPGMKLIIP